MADERIESLSRGLKLLDALWPHAGTGLTPGEVVRAAQESPSYVSRCLRTLEAAGYAERVPETERWRPSVQAVRRLNAVRQSLETAEGRLAEYRERTGKAL